MRRLLLVLTLAAALGFSALGVAQANDGKLHILWLGQAAWRITTPGGKIIVIDPWLTTNPKTPPEYKNLDKIGKMDLILLTHAHPDHFGDTPALAKKYNARVLGPSGMDRQLQTLGILPAELTLRMNKGGTFSPIGPDIKITMVHAEHNSEFAWKDADGKEHIYDGGEPVGFIITFENGMKVYDMGDTGLFGDMKLIGEYYKPNIILIPIGGHYVMSPEDAAYAINTWLKPAHAIPMHYGTVPLLKGTPEEFISALGNTSTKVHVMKPGDEITF